MIARPFRSLAVRAAVSGLVVGTIAISGAAAWNAQAQSIAGFNSNAPVDYSANRIELQDKQNRVVLSGDVAIAQGDLRIRAARTVVAYTDNGELKIQRIDASGGVVVSRGTQTARGDVGLYDFNRRIITLVGNVALQRANDNLNGARLVIDLNTGLASVDGRGSSAAGAAPGGGGRVSGSFTVPKRTN